MRLNQVTVTVTDVPRAIEFYVKLGLQLIVHTSDDYARFLCPNGGSTFSVHRSDTPPAGGTVVYFECEDLDQRVAALQALGLRFDREPANQPWLWREAYLSDPDGNSLCLFWAGENRLNPPWRLRAP